MNISRDFTNKFFGITGLRLLFSIVLMTSIHNVNAQTTINFNYTGAQQNWVVPSGVTSVFIEVWGAQGNPNNQGNVAGGLGGYANGDLAVTPGQVLYIYVGGGWDGGVMGGYNGGGNAGTSNCAAAQGGGGGGASDVRQGGNATGDRKIVAGGGGGAGGNRLVNCGRGTGGGGGGGYYGGGGGAAWPFESTVLPTGGDQVSPGAGGQSSWTLVPDNDGYPGILNTGGRGGNEESSSQFGSANALSGGEGGGVMGSSGLYLENWTGQSGAGGSSYLGGVTNGMTLSGQRSGYGLVRITYVCVMDITCPPDVTVNAAPNSCYGYAAVGNPAISDCGHNALDFDGINDGVTVATGYSGSDEITIEMWINPRVKNDWDVFINHDTWNVAGKIHYQFTPGGTIEFAVFGNNPTNQHASISPGVNQWNHIAAVYSKAGKYVRFYLNGVFTNQANYSVAQTIGTFPFKIGNWDGVSRFLMEK